MDNTSHPASRTDSLDCMSCGRLLRCKWCESWQADHAAATDDTSEDAAYVRAEFDGLTLAYPHPDDPLGIEWALRYGALERRQQLVAASYVAAYRQLVCDSQRSRNRKVSALRRALRRTR